METGRLVVVSCSSPREKFWGVLLQLGPVGLTVRGLALDTFEDWLQQHVGDGGDLLGPVTLFLPIHRVERVELDETVGAVEGIGSRFLRVTGREPVRTLLGGAYREDDDSPQM